MNRLILVFLFFILPLQALSQSLPEPLSDTVSDFANLLPADSEARVQQALIDGRAETGVHVVLVTMNRIAEFGGQGQRIEDYAKALFNKWGVGDAARDDGILILVARDDREMRIALGAGYEVIWDNAAQRVIDRYFLPAFRDDDYAGGIEAGIPATFDLIAAPHAAGTAPPNPKPQSKWEDLGPIAVFVAMIGGALAFIARRAISDSLVGFRFCPSCGARHLSRTRRVIDPATKTAEGHGVAETRCSACGYHDDQPYSIPRQSSRGSSGGFGGGSSSGGGATGRW